jgi:hypothetical protein
LLAKTRKNGAVRTKQNGESVGLHCIKNRKKMKVNKNCAVSLTVLVLLAAVTCVSAKNFVTSFDDDDYEFNGGPTEQLLAMAVPHPEELFRQDSKPLERNLDVEPKKNCSQYCPNDMYFRDTPRT